MTFAIRLLALSMALLLSVAALPVASQPSPKFEARIVEFGVFNILGDQEERAAPGSVAGKVSGHSNSELVQETTSLKAELGVTFGFRYVVLGLPDGEHEGFEIKATHPPMRGPDGRMATTSQAPTEAFSENGVAGNDLFYTLDKDYEVLPGTWRLELLYRGQVVLSKEFVLR